MMIEETCVRISELKERAVADRQARYARRNKIRYIDDLINEFELLNLADEAQIPRDLEFKVVTFIRRESHPLATKANDDVRIADWMEALYDVQDALMVPFEDDTD
jgi:hypothetical protein